jgi:hypothetical protein
MEATLNLLQALFKDIHGLLGNSVLLQSQGLPGLGQALLEKGGCAQAWVSLPVSLLTSLFSFSPELQC